MSHQLAIPGARLMSKVWSRSFALHRNWTSAAGMSLGQAFVSFPSIPRIFLRALRPQVPALERAQPPLVCQVAMPWTRPGGESWTASKSS